ncbi:hypothetical protein BDB01DRAFT_30282 [Pilobolus umbonatus]|nr:hypothetical protein BDB01DRAFT_30282 [Pilobolus umbonatus]
MNLQARESIRFLDQKLLETKIDKPSTSFLRTQKVNEKLADWHESKKYWIGEESRSKMVKELISSEDSDDDDDDVESTSSIEDLMRPRRGEDSSDESEEASDSEEEEEDDVEAYNYDEIFEDDVPYTYEDVPKLYQPIISCLLYYHSMQEQGEDDTVKSEHLVLVTNDDDLSWWAELFGDPQSGRRLLVKTVEEWNKIVSTIDFEKAYEHSWKHR